MLDTVVQSELKKAGIICLMQYCRKSVHYYDFSYRYKVMKTITYHVVISYILITSDILAKRKLVSLLAIHFWPSVFKEVTCTVYIVIR